MNKLILITFTFLSQIAFAGLQEQSDFICSQIVEKPNFEAEDHFSKSFLERADYNRLVSIFQNIYADDGACKKAAIYSNLPQLSKVELTTNTAHQRLRLSLDENGLITSLLYDGRDKSHIRINDINSIPQTLNQLGGISSVKVYDLTNQRSVYDYKSNERLALGSEFKLYVLSYLNDLILNKKISWSDQMALQDDLKSLPSGKMWQLPTGTKSSLQQYAENMISISDNTATDHLINLLGRQNIQNSMVGFNSYLHDNSPLMMTMDLFRSRTLAEDQVNQYVQSNESDRLLILDNLKKSMSFNEVAEKLSDWSQPRYINKMEWFASTDDICKTILKIKIQSDQDKTIYDILSKNTPFIWTEKDQNFSYAGYKGGSEEGVITMTYLLKLKNQKWICLSMGVNDEKQNLNDTSVFNTFQAILNYFGEELGK